MPKSKYRSRRTGLTNRTNLAHRTAPTRLSRLSRLTRRPRLTRFGLAALIILVVVLVKPVLLHRDSGWVDLPAPQPEVTRPTMNIEQIVLSLNDVLKKYESLPTSANVVDQKSLIAKLDRLYRLSAQDYENTAALQETGDNSLLDDLRQGGSLLTSSIFERKDSLAFPGNFGQTQLQASRTDLAAAASAIARVDQELKK
ncbi:Hypothetical protein DEACI_0096 [Acididesulfobacillus acetoxydans]|uniref:Uncharacterized protein n=1 Tax=Acididesulfobacillus acetoxydans TaxID=1561005 RepID=A0A8S0VVH3_9FIRM|nr:hypothetical protein [Acididesulfobacillus acetoxydans]CAA7599473.1 Hypothetical protein DEACI_0096 [Acididesulfobacillus acetoxydans]CEJ06722.1 Hypothetical protein DEACI_1172 [Acididesulfobacillus acetoxydans]